MTESAALFKRCMLDAAAADMKELDAEMTVPTDFSAAHARKMSGILGFRVHSHSIAKRALIILIAAAFLLTGCTVAVYFGTSRNVEVVFRPGGRSIEITFSGDGVVVDDGAWSIEEYMEFGYVPEDFKLEYGRSDKHRNSLIYKSQEKYGIIRFEQFVASKIRYSFTYYNWGDLYKIYYKDYEILVYGTGSDKVYAWTDGVYGYFMHFMFPIERDDMAISIIEGLRPMTPSEDAENGEIS